MSLTREQLREFDQHLDQLEQHYGVALDDQDRRQVLEASLRRGFSPDATERIVGEIAADLGDDDPDDYQDDVLDEDDEEEFDEDAERAAIAEHFQNKLGRMPVEDETKALLEGRTLDGADPYNLDTLAGRVEYQAARINDAATGPEHEVAERLEAQINNTDPDTQAGRMAYYEARLNGYDVEDE